MRTKSLSIVLPVAYDTIMKLTVSADFGLIRGEADQAAMFKGVDAAQTYRAMVCFFFFTAYLLARKMY